MSHRINKSKFQKRLHQRQLPEIYFQGFITTKSYSKLRSCYKHISCKCIRENVTERLKNIGAETKSFGLHSLQAGDVTAAANLGANDRFFKKY